MKDFSEKRYWQRLIILREGRRNPGARQHKSSMRSYCFFLPGPHPKEKGPTVHLLPTTPRVQRNPLASAQPDLQQSYYCQWKCLRTLQQREKETGVFGWTTEGTQKSPPCLRCRRREVGGRREAVGSGPLFELDWKTSLGQRTEETIHQSKIPYIS